MGWRQGVEDKQGASIRDLLDKVKPTLADIESKTVETLDLLCHSLSQSRLCPSSLAVPCVVLAVKQHAGLPAPDTFGLGFRGQVARRFALKNVAGIAQNVCAALPKLERATVDECVRNACKTWLVRVYKENGLEPDFENVQVL